MPRTSAAAGAVVATGGPVATGWAKGIALGLLNALIGGTYMVASRSGVSGDLQPADLVALRFGIAGIIMLPFLLCYGVTSLAGLGWRHGLLLAVGAGPLFGFLLVAGYEFAPLAHGAVIVPGCVTLSAMVLAWCVLGERLAGPGLIGNGLVVLGIVLIGWDGLRAASGGAWIGDLMFVAAGVLWGLYTLWLRQWSVDPLRATAVVAVLSAAIVLPVYLVTAGGRLLAAAPGEVAVQALVQGVLSGVLSMVTFSGAVRALGAARAALFPALVPAIAILVGIPALGEIPSVAQTVGLVTVTLGLTCAVGLGLRLPRRRGRHRGGHGRRRPASPLGLRPAGPLCPSARSAGGAVPYRP